MSVEAVSLNEIIKSVTYEGGDYSAPPRSAPPVKEGSPPGKKIETANNLQKEILDISNGKNSKEEVSFKELDGMESIKENIQKNYEKIKERIQSLENTELKFEKDKETKRNIIKILDKKTKKVIKQIPPKEFYKFIVELYKQNQKNAEKMKKKTQLRENRQYNEALNGELKGLILNRNI